MDPPLVSIYTLFLYVYDSFSLEGENADCAVNNRVEIATHEAVTLLPCYVWLN